MTRHTLGVPHDRLEVCVEHVAGENGVRPSLLLPLALLLRERHWLRRLVQLVTGTELLSLTFFKQAYMLNYFAMILVPTWVIFRQEREERALARAGDELPSSGALAPPGSEKELRGTVSASD